MTLMQKAILNAIQSFDYDQLTHTLVSEFLFGEKFPGFTGHFPDFPILPAICQIESVLVACSKYLNKELRIKRIKKAKFASMVHPGDTVEVRIEIKNEDDLYGIKAALFNSSVKVSSFTMIMEL